MKSDGFVTIERPLLEALVERETLEIAEVELFKRVAEWATKESKKQGIVAHGQEKRRIIGERIVKAIRFPVMKQEEFVSVVIDSKILTYDEVGNVFKYLNSVQSPFVGFPVTKRSGPSSKLMRCRRFNLMQFGWKNLDREHSIVFSVDGDILFHGVNLFGSKDNTYSVNLELFAITGMYFLMRRSTRNFNIPPPPPGKPRAFELRRLDRSNSRPLGPKWCSNAPPYRRICLSNAPPKEQSLSAPVMSYYKNHNVNESDNVNQQV